MRDYLPQKIEPKWQEKWEEEQIYCTPQNPDPRNKRYILDMFPYPSGAGLHVGHIEGYSGTDVVSRYLRMKGFDILHPMGWDAFGLPAENYAIKTGIHPQETTRKNIDTYRQQIKSAGLSYDWNREVNTSDPDYYRWTQWLFLQFYKNNLAYRKEARVNWCPSCQTVLANEQVITKNEESVCERCATVVSQKELEQWFFRITKYQDELLEALDRLDWPESTKQGQRHWIGKSVGIEIDFKIKGVGENVKVFTTRPDTIDSATFMVLAPEHPLVSRLDFPKEYARKVREYVDSALARPDRERKRAKNKTGVFTGYYSVNPYNGEELPVWISDFVLMDYGTGAIMAVPVYDERDREFAEKFDLPVVENELLDTDEITRQVMEEGWGRETTHYRLRDWLISRQRYWGAPIPVVYCQECGEAKKPAVIPVPERDLPIQLPEDVDFEPAGESPLTKSKKFHDVKCPRCGAQGEGVWRESDTMDTFVDSSWYFLRFCDPKNSEEFTDREKMHEWMPVDFYVGGAEHTVLHLLYSRFFVKALRDFGWLDFDEPFLKLRHQGTVLGTDGRDMSKRYGNIINPDEVINRFGADTLRMYELFMGPFEGVKAWDTGGVKGIRRFLDRVWKYGDRDWEETNKEPDREPLKKLNQAIKKVGEDIRELKFNTAIAVMMEFMNEVEGCPIEASEWEKFLKILAPFAPHITEELWQTHFASDNKGFVSVHQQSWPQYDGELVQEEVVTIAVQVDGKTRGTIEVGNQESRIKNQVEEKARAEQNVQRYLQKKSIEEVIFVPGKIINFVTN